ncbi:phage major capsid protein [Blautia coccoides]|uniref:phage major capsid protein n=1 Tax=Blautia producta TaxID=33035 RepID=UPI0028A4C212|nr:phage major capsid protein [Blautia coccoides]MDT4373008.1 phage major capsid protein [Blautia coccoides]
MRNKDLLKQENMQLMQSLSQALKDDDQEAMAAAFTQFANGVQERIMEEYGDLRQTQDAAVLASRGIRQLTSEEKVFYQTWIDASKSPNPQQALVDIQKAMPETIIDSVIEDMQEAHPLLSAIDFINCQGAIKMIVNADNIDLATWDALTTAIATELAGKIDTMDMTLAKLSAFIPVAKDMLALGPVWLDNYVRIILSEASAGGLEKGILKGSGKNQPIGMCKDLDGAVTQGVYADKTKVKLTTLEPVEYCAAVAPLAKKPLGGYRTVPEVMLVVNPVDYIQKVLPSSTVRATDGTYKNNVFPYPTKVVQSAVLDEGEGIMGLAKKYFMGIGAGSSGKIEYSDEYQFLEDNRVYITKMYGMGRPKDNNAFQYLDITSLKPMPLKVEVTNGEENPVVTKAKAGA